MFQKPTAGQSLQTTPIASATFQSHLVDVVDDFNRHKMGAPKDKQTPPVKSNEIRIANGSAADRRKGEVLKIGTFSLSDVDRRTLWFNGTVPTDSTDTVAVLLEPIKYADTGYFPAQVTGVVPALVDMQTSGDKFAVIDPSSAVLKSATSSGMFPILHAPSGTGEKECVILMDRSGGAPGVFRRNGPFTLYDSSAHIANDFLSSYSNNIGYLKLSSPYATVDSGIELPSTSDVYADGTFICRTAGTYRFDFSITLQQTILDGSGSPGGHGYPDNNYFASDYASPGTTYTYDRANYKNAGQFRVRLYSCDNGYAATSSNSICHAMQSGPWTPLEYWYHLSATWFDDLDTDQKKTLAIVYDSGLPSLSYDYNFLHMPQITTDNLANLGRVMIQKI